MESWFESRPPSFAREARRSGFACPELVEGSSCPAVVESFVRGYNGGTMSSQILIRKLHKEVGELRDDVRTMKRFLTSPLKDGEGEYRESFIRKMLARSQSRGPFRRFTTREAFLKHVRSKV